MKISITRRIVLELTTEEFNKLFMSVFEASKVGRGPTKIAATETYNNLVDTHNEISNSTLEKTVGPFTVKEEDTIWSEM